MPRQANAPSTRRKKRAPKEDVRLTGDRIVVRNPDDGERQTRGGLLIPATAVPAPKRCLWSAVVLVGPDVRAVKAGDRILFLPQSALEAALNVEEVLRLRAPEVHAAVSPLAGE